MTPINNSDTAWLITTDYNQEHNLPYIDLRNDIISPDVNDWLHEEDHNYAYLGPVLGNAVGDIDNGVGCVNIEIPDNVGDYVQRNVWIMRAPIGKFVGGHRNFSL